VFQRNREFSKKETRKKKKRYVCVGEGEGLRKE
jgi:hypothetical protein